MSSASEWGVTSEATVPMASIISKVKDMVRYDSPAQRLASKHGLAVQSVSFEDCARDKGSVWGPSISDMTLQVNEHRMPVIREPNFTDTTWDIQLDQFPVTVGNQVKGGPIKSIPLSQYLSEMNSYCTAEVNIKGGSLLKSEESHCIVSAQCCFLPVEKGKETKFNVALYSYQSRKGDPALMTIVCTSKGTSAQIIEGNEQLLLFNNGGTKADFSAQRLKDNRAERGVKLTGELSKSEKQDNVIIIVQVPLKQKSPAYAGGMLGGFIPYADSDDLLSLEECSGPPLPMAVPMAAPGLADFSFGGASKSSAPVSSSLMRSKKKRREEKADVEAAIIKVAKRTTVVCRCGADLKETRASLAYGPSIAVNCDGCGKRIGAKETVYHCERGRCYAHSGGFDLCLLCAMKQLQFDECGGTALTLERDERFPIRVTLQYYKSTANGVVDESIMQAIYALLQSSKKKADFVGSLVTDTDPDRPTEWVKAGGAAVDSSYALVAQLLLDAGCFEDYFAKFKDEEINDDTLPCFTEASEFKEVIPKVGPRMRFFAALKKNRQSRAERPEVEFMDGLF